MLGVVTVSRVWDGAPVHPSFSLNVLPAVHPSIVHAGERGGSSGATQERLQLHGPIVAEGVSQQ